MPKIIDRDATNIALEKKGFKKAGFCRAHGFSLSTFKKYFSKPSPILPGCNMTTMIEAALKKNGVAIYMDGTNEVVRKKNRNHILCTKQNNVKRKAA